MEIIINKCKIITILGETKKSIKVTIEEYFDYCGEEKKTVWQVFIIKNKKIDNNALNLMISHGDFHHLEGYLGRSEREVKINDKDTYKIWEKNIFIDFIK